MKDTTCVGIASIPSRTKNLEKVLDSLTNQVDEIQLVLNYGEHPVPAFLNKYSNVWWYVATGERGDAMKFAYADKCKGYFFPCDDDLIFPDGYVAYLKTGVDHYDGLVSLHGRNYITPVTSFMKWSENYRCLGMVTEDAKVNLIGSGCCAFHTDKLKVTLSDFKQKNMADLFLSKLATEQQVPMMVLKHAKDYLTYTHPLTTIWRSTKDYSAHTEILKSFVK
jgi:hypothetical protein